MRPSRGAAYLIAAAVLAFAAGAADAEVNVNVNIGPPAVVVHEPPEMVVIPQTMVYFAPGVSVELLFHNGFWWTVSDGRWFRATAYGGPWVVVHRPPAAIVHLPPNYRTVYIKEKHIPYGQLKKHYRAREVERREGRGEWRKETKVIHKEGYRGGSRTVIHKEVHKEGKGPKKGKGRGRDD